MPFKFNSVNSRLSKPVLIALTLCIVVLPGFYPPQKLNIIEISLVQLNDVYEISTLDSGRAGGLARVATVVKELRSKNRNVYTMLAGDFLFPSALGTIRSGPKNKELKGFQMVDVMNALPVDMVTFGNHEFDIKNLDDLQQRIDTSAFDWISANVVQKGTGQPLTKMINGKRVPIPPAKILSFKNELGQVVRVGVLGVTINSTVSDYVDYTDEEKAIRESIQYLKNNKADVIIALTHLKRERDIELAKLFPEIKLFIGGHEHTNSIDTIHHASGKKSFVTKADANGRTVFIHALRYNTVTRELSVNSQLIPIDEQIQEDPRVAGVVRYWNNWADSIWRVKGYVPCKVLATLHKTLDGTEASIRYKATNLTDLIAKAIYEACGDSANIDASIYNSGSIRLDDSIRNQVTQYDIIRTIPYSGKIYIVEMKGHMLKKMLDTSMRYPGDGSFLQYYNITDWGTSWKINNKHWHADSVYRIAITDYLAEGYENKMNFFKPTADGVLSIDRNIANSLRADLIQAVSAFIEKHYAKPSGDVVNDKKVPCY
ncbi:MAG: bifunctional metallophosphatase/5'-nucleotidase [Chitinophagaceae bacterium]